MAHKFVTEEPTLTTCSTVNNTPCNYHVSSAEAKSSRSQITSELFFWGKNKDTKIYIGNVSSFYNAQWLLWLKSGIHKSPVRSRPVTKSSMMVPNICGSSVCNLLHVTLVTPKILR